MPTVTWENISSNLQINGNKIRRSQPTGDYWPGANIVDTIKNGTGFLEFKVVPPVDPSTITTIVGINKDGRVAANDEYNFSFYFSDSEVFAYEYGDLGAYPGIPYVEGASYRLKTINGDVEYQVKNPGDGDYSTFVTSALHMEISADYTVNVTIRIVGDGLHILAMS